MNLSIVLIFVVLITVGVIGLVCWYLKAGYSYQHTIDEIPDKDIEKENN